MPTCCRYFVTDMPLCCISNCKSLNSSYHYCDCKGPTKLQLLQRVFQRMLTEEKDKSLAGNSATKNAAEVRSVKLCLYLLTECYHAVMNLASTN